MVCNCGGIFNVIRIEEYPKDLKKENLPLYNRVCDVQCLNCGAIRYSQPYDFGARINPVKSLYKE